MIEGTGLTNFGIKGSLTTDPWFEFISDTDFEINSSNTFLKYYNISPAQWDDKLFIGFECPYFNNFRLYGNFNSSSVVKINIYCKQ